MLSCRPWWSVKAARKIECSTVTILLRLNCFQRDHRCWLMGIPQLQVSISHVATFLRSVWNVLDKVWRRQAAVLHSFKDRFDQIWVTLSHDFTRVGKHSSTVHSKLRGTGASDVADDCQSWVSSLHCYVHKGLYSVSSVYLIFIVRKKNSGFIFFSFYSLASESYSCGKLTWCHPDSNCDSKICTDILVRLNVCSIKYLCHVVVR